MITGDSSGDIFAWRCDAKGWYQLLRKFKRDASNPTATLGAPDISTGGGILSLTMHPDKHKGQMLALSRQPARLKVINMSTYKTQCECAGYAGYSHAATTTAGGVFNRAQYSADGRFAIAGSSVKAEDGLYRLQLWDTSTGHVVRTPLSGSTYSHRLILLVIVPETADFRAVPLFQCVPLLLRSLHIVDTFSPFFSL